MLRITRKETGEFTTLHLEGKLIGDWVGELERCWAGVNPRGSHRQCRIDLSEISFIDEQGKALVEHLAAEGAELWADNPFMRLVIERILAQLRPHMPASKDTQLKTVEF